MEERTLTVRLRVDDDEHFSVKVTDDETGMSRTFDQDTFNIDVAIGVEIMSWVDSMCSEEGK